MNFFPLEKKKVHFSKRLPTLSARIKVSVVGHCPSQAGLGFGESVPLDRALPFSRTCHLAFDLVAEPELGIFTTSRH